MTINFASRILVVSAAIVAMGASCIQIKGAGPSGNDGGLFKSVDKGAGWTQRSAIASTGAARSFGALNVTEMIFDPSDPKAIYLGTDGGLMYSYDSAESWHVASTLGQVRVNGAAVHYGNKCILYVATGNRVERSADCARNWVTVHTDARPNAAVTDVVADHFNKTSLYITNSFGDLLKSTDEGASWTTIHRFDSNIRQLHMKSTDSRVLFVVTATKGIWRTTDGGENWTDLTPKFGTFAGALDNVTLVEDVKTPGAYLTASNYGILRSTDGGDNWSAIPLLTPPGSTVIYSLAVNPKNSNEIWYGTINLLYRTVDGGAKWITGRSPTSRSLTRLVPDAINENVLYLGTTKIEQKKSGF